MRGVSEDHETYHIIQYMCLRSSYPESNDFGFEIIPLAVKEHNIQVSLILCLAFHIIQYICFLSDVYFILLARHFCSMTFGRISKK